LIHMFRVAHFHINASQILMPFAKSIKLLFSYCSVLIGMAAALCSTVAIKQDNSLAEPLFLSALSFSAGLYAGDPNTISFFQYKFSKNERSCSGYWSARLIASVVLSFPISFLTPNLDIRSFIAGVLIGYIFPSGRVSDEAKFPVVTRRGGFIKVVASALCISSLYMSGPAWLTTAFFMSGIASNYASSIPFQITYIINRNKNRSFRYQVKRFLCFDHDMKARICGQPVRNDTISLIKNFLAGLPVHIYATFGGFIFSFYRGNELLPDYYLWERILRGLGGTVLPLMSFTSTKISLNHNLSESRSIKNLVKFCLVYAFVGLCISFLFYTLFSLSKPITMILRFRLSAFDLLPLAICTVSLYVSTVLGTLVLQVGNYKRYFFLSTLAGAFSLPILVQLQVRPIMIISLTELCVSVVQLLSLFYLWYRNRSSTRLQNT